MGRTRMGRTLVRQVRSSEKRQGSTLVRQFRSSEKGIGRTLVQQVWSSEKKPGRTLILSLGSEFGERNGPNPGSAGSEFFFFFLTHVFFFFHLFFVSFFFFSFFIFFYFFVFCCFFFQFIYFLLFFHFFFHFFSFFFIFYSKLRSKEKGTGLSPNSEPAEQGLGPVISPNSVPAEPGFGQVLTPNSEPARVRRKELAFLRSPNLPNQDNTCSFSELRTCPTRVIPVLSPNSELKLRTPGKNTILDHLGNPIVMQWVQK